MKPSEAFPEYRAKSGGLTLEDIRAGLGLTSAKCQSSPHVTRKTSEQKALSSALEPPKSRADTGKTGSATTHSRSPPSETIRKIAYLCDELLELISLFEDKRVKTAKEWSEMCRVVRQFESLYDSVRVRESQFLDKVVDQQKKFELRESKYANLKKRALVSCAVAIVVLLQQHIREAQSERDRLFIETEAMKARTQELENQLKQIQTYVLEQKQTIQDLREKAKNMPSEKEITELNLRFRHLQNENAQLMTDRATLKLTLDELTGEMQKKLPSGHPDFLNASLGLRWVKDGARFSKSSLPGGVWEDEPAGGKQTQRKVDAEIQHLERLADELRTTLEEQQTEFKTELESLREKKRQFEDYKTAMEAMLKSAGVDHKP